VAAGELTFVNRAAADLIELPSLGIAIDDPVTDGAPKAPAFLLEPAREAMRTGRVIGRTTPASTAGTAALSRSPTRRRPS